MKNLRILFLLVSLIMATGCAQRTPVATQIPQLTSEGAYEIISHANNKFICLTNFGEGIPGNSSNNIDDQPLEINGDSYYYFGTAIDTQEEYNAYLQSVFTDETIQKVNDIFEITEYQGKLVGKSYDIGNGLAWEDAKITAVEQNNDLAEVSMQVPSLFDENDFSEEEFDFKYVEGRGWVIDTDTPYEVY